VRITATAPGADGVTIGLGSVEGRVVPPQPISGSDTCPSGGSDPDR
jgi:hypothetical protein